MRSYFTSTAISSIHFPGMILNNKDSVVLSDTLTGNGVNYRMHSVVVGKDMDFDVHTLPYNEEQRCKIFQDRNLHHMTLPFKIDRRNITDVSYKNENYKKEL